jgi:FkbM family methyltransferase
VAEASSGVTFASRARHGTRVGGLGRAASKVLNYLRVRPARDSDRRRLWGALIRALLCEITRPTRVETVGLYLTGTEPLQVRFGGISARVRPGTDDLAILLGNHEPEVMRWFAPRAGEVVVDAGAHIGVYTLRAAHAGARVLAFEPDPGTASMLAGNIRLNGFQDVTVRQVALGDVAGEVSLYIPSDYAGRASVAHSRPSDTVRTVPLALLDDELLALGVGGVDWLKVDVEGAEVELLRGAVRTLDRTGTVILEVEHGREDACRGLLRDRGFEEVERVVQTTQDYWLLRRPGPGP